jgi:hypothetical protein
VSRRTAAAGVAAVVLALAACSGGDGASHAGSGDSSTSEVSLATTTSTTEAPLTGEPLVVAEQGLSSFPDPIDPAATLGGYGVVLQNPNATVMATGVLVTTRILGPDGAELLVDRSLLNAVMPGARMAVGRTLIEPITDPTSLDVRVEVTAWLEPASPGAALSVDRVVTEPEANGGAVTRFVVSSTWPTSEDGVDVTAIYRAADGRILAAESQTLASVGAKTATPGQIRLLSPIPDLAATEVLVGRGIAAQTTG